MNVLEYIGQKEVVIWGTDREAVDIYYRMYKSGIVVNCFFDNNSTGEELFLGRKVFKPSRERIKDNYVMVACKNDTYFIIAKQLKGWGLEEVKDFLFYDCFGKRIALIHGNCHVDIIRQYLSRVRGFCEKYAIYPNVLIFSNEAGYIENELLRNCDLLITQDIRDDNKYSKKLSAKYLKGMLSDESKCIVIPNLFGLGKGFFPLTENNSQNCSLRCGQNYNGMFPRKISIVEELLDAGMSEDDIIEKLKSTDLLSKKFVIQNFNVYLEKIRNRELFCDVKVYNYIVKEYKKTKLFYDPGHPTNYIIKEMVHQILKLIDIEESLVEDGVNSMDAYEEPILPCVYKELGLEFECESIRNGIFAYKLSATMDLEEYVKEYIFYLRCSKEG